MANLHTLKQCWGEFSLSEFQRTLDSTANDLAVRQDEADISKRRLIEQSRQFKKETPEDIRKMVAPLLKSFQQEVDSLSKRSKFAETSFLTVYKKLVDLPDPTNGLEYGISLQKKLQKMQDFEMENTQLRKTLEEYNSEFAQIKNQEVTIKNLKDRIKELERSVEEQAEKIVEEHRKELQKEFLVKEKEFHDSQMEIAKKLGLAEQKNIALQQHLQVSQSELFDLKAKSEERSAARSDELDILLSDLEKANERASQAERDRELMRVQLIESQQKNSVSELQKSNEQAAQELISRYQADAEIAAKDKEIASLVTEIQRLQNALNSAHTSTERSVERIQNQLHDSLQKINTLESELASRNDYEDIKKELSILKSVEFSGVTSDDFGPSGNLEKMLVAKNKRLENEVTLLKKNNNEMKDKFDYLQNQYTDINQRYNDQVKLSNQLEEDLRNVDLLTIPRGEGEGSSTPIPAPNSRDIIANVLETSLSEQVFELTATQHNRLYHNNDYINVSSC